MSHDNRRVRRLLLNPLVAITLVVVIMTTGWMLYTGGTSNIAQARPGANLLPALVQPATAGTTKPADPWAMTGALGGWDVSHSGDAQTSLALVDGQESDHALKLDVAHVTSGDVTLTSPQADLVPGRTYLFKAITTSDAEFTLLVRKHHTDGSTSLEQVRNPLQNTGNAPIPVSDAFDSGNTTTAVEYIFRLASTGTLQVEGAYLEAADDVRLPPGVTTTANNIPAPEPADGQHGPLDLWSPYSSGESTVESGRGADKDGNFFWTRVADYQSGEAKWQYPPIPVTSDRMFQFGATYESEQPVDVVAEFELANGGRAFHNLVTVPPAGEWTTIAEEFQVPNGAKSAMVTLVSHGDGTTRSRGYFLTEVTKPGALRWDKPMVSIAFDDGWQSAYDRALPLLNKHGFRSTQYLNASTLETPNYMTAAEVQQLHDAGHEIAAHSYDHVDLTSLATDRLDDELRRGKEALAAAGLPTEDLATPYGRSDAQVDWYASKYYNIVRGTDDGINTRQNLDPHNLKVFYVTSETTPDELAQVLADTSQVNGWLVLVYHQIAPAESTGIQGNTIATDRSTITSDALAAQLELIDKSGIEVQPVSQAFGQLQGP